MIVDEMHHEHPELIRDQYWDEVFPSELPYTIATENNREEHPEHSTARVAVPVRQRSMVLSAPSQVKIDEMNPSNTVSYKFDPPEVRFDHFISMLHARIIWSLAVCRCSGCRSYLIVSHIIFFVHFVTLNFYV